MKIIKFLLVLLSLAFFLNGCSSFKEAGKVLRNEKTTSTDEFLVKKKDALTQPPDFDSIPKPGTLEQKKKENNFKRMLKSKDTNSTTSKSSSTENSILNKIKK
jgi:PBP1b-binding outer membrane lipoprotein LpoB